MKLARLALATALAGSLLALDYVAVADPDAVAEAKQKLDALHAEASTLEQEAIEAQSASDAAQVQLERAQADLTTQREKVDQLSDQLGSIAVLQMQSAGINDTVKLLTSSAQEDFLSSLAVVESETQRTNASLQQLQNDQAKLTSLERTAAEAQREKAENAQLLAERSSEFEAKIDEAQALYDRLSAEEQERLARLQQQEEERRAQAAAAEAARTETTSRDNVRNTEASTGSDETEDSSQQEATQSAPAPASGRAETVVSSALAQVGKGYRMATMGPNTFDCSGLTSYAYRQVGITLPRTSRAQYSGAGRAVSVSDIQPGDLVFYYSGPSHVGIYIGDGKIVHAANPRSGVTVTGLHTMPLKGVRRVL